MPRLRWLLVALAACGPAPRPPSPPRSASVHVAAGTAWIQFSPMSTFACARLPDGQYRSFSYGVGTGFVLQEGHELTLAARDASCGPRDILVLGARGELAWGYEDSHRAIGYQLLDVEPEARSLGWLEGPCWVDAAGKPTCIAEPRSTAAQLAELFAAQGPIQELLRGAPCALMRDHRVICAQVNGTAALIPEWPDVVAASVYSRGWSQYGGCAVLRSGKVSCFGESWLGQRGFLAKIDPKVPTEVPGLDGVDEVAASPANACARRGGRVFCWGSAGQRACGDAALEASRPVARCVVDRAATRAAENAYESAQRECHDPNRRHQGDDPLCRSMWRAAPPGPIFEGGGIGCDPTTNGHYRWAPPTRVEDVDDAIAIGTNGSLSCAVRASGALTCWGVDQKGTRTLAFPARTAVATSMPAITVAPRGASVSVGEERVVVTSASGHRAAYALGKGLGPAQPLEDDVVDAIAAPHFCALHAGGRVACDLAETWKPGFPTAVDGVRLSTMFGQGCVLSREGVLRCGPRPSSNWEATREGAELSAAGPIVEASARCALGSDRSVRCDLERGKPLRVVWTHVAELAVDSIGYLGCAVLDDATVACTGGNSTFQRGEEGPEQRAFGADVTAVAGLPPIASVAVSTTHACALAKDGSLWCWGRATEGETGAAARAAASVKRQCSETVHDACETPDVYGPTRRLARPTRVGGLARAVAVGASNGRTCVLTEGGDLACFGRGMAGMQTMRTAR